MLLPETLDPELDLTSTAGDISVSGFFVDTTLTSAAGDILIAGGTANLTLETTAGDINARNVDPMGEVRSTSTAGSTRLNLTTAPSAMTVETTAGDQLIRVPLGDYDITTDTLMGEVTNSLGSDPDSTYPYRFTSTMGDIAIEQKR
jgi:DUF4097 and DUF4098 domain-containing protein YvlB